MFCSTQSAGTLNTPDMSSRYCCADALRAHRTTIAPFRIIAQQKVCRRERKGKRRQPSTPEVSSSVSNSYHTKVHSVIRM